MDVDLQNALFANRLIQLAERAERRRMHPLERTPTLKEDMEADQVLLEGGMLGYKPVGLQEQAGPVVNIEQEQIHLKDLIGRLQELQEKNTQDGQTAQTTRVASETRTLEWEMNFTVLEKVEGLVVRDRTLAETDRYRFDFSNGTELTITDKWTRKSTRIWGDPHIDTNDEEGANNGDFKDLTRSDTHTTFMLMDGARLTITARDDGIIEEVDIFKGSQHVKGVGNGSTNWNDETGLFAKQVLTDGVSAGLCLNSGDAVYAGGDGNDWFDRGGCLVWGATSGPIVTRRPDALISYKASYKVEREVIQIDQQI